MVEISCFNHKMHNRLPYLLNYSGSAKDIAHSHNTLLQIPSGPEALDMLKPLKILKISSGVVDISLRRCGLLYVKKGRALLISSDESTRPLLHEQPPTGAEFHLLLSDRKLV